jgi:hypothetical protein
MRFAHAQRCFPLSVPNVIDLASDLAAWIHLRGPMNWNLDVAISRRFQFGENRRIDLRAESFNVLNRFRPNDPNTTLNNTNFGKITSAQDPRIMQFAAKYVF